MTHLTIQEMYPKEYLPRERLIKYGPQALTDQELLAIVLKTGSRKRNVMDLAREILSRYKNLYNVKKLSIEELMSFDGIGTVKAADVLAAAELGSRIAQSQAQFDGLIDSSQSAGNYFLRAMHGLEQEHVLALYLTTKNEVINLETVFKGSLNSSIVHPREIFKGAVRKSAARIILAHNHPSGHTKPSQADLDFTERVAACGDLMGIEILDHFIIGGSEYLSLKEEGYF